MMKKASIAIVALLVAATSALLLAQGAPGPPGPPPPPDPAAAAQHRVQHMTTLLALTADQQTQAASIFTQAASAEATAHDALKTAEQNLHTATKTGNGNIDQLAATVGALTGQIAAIRAKADAAFYQILTADQQSKLTQFEADGPGGPRPPGGGPMDHPPMMGDR